MLCGLFAVRGTKDGDDQVDGDGQGTGKIWELFMQEHFLYCNRV